MKTIEEAQALFIQHCKGYVDEICQPGIPVISTSHYTLARLYGMYGAKKVQAEIDRQLAERREGSQ